MATTSLSYQRLKNDTWLDEGDDYYGFRKKAIGRLRNSRLRRLNIKRKLRVKIPSLRRFLKRKAKVVKIAFNKVCRRLKESQSHFGDLFAGNYLFVQVAPTPLKYDVSNKSDFVKGHHHHHLPGLSVNNYSIPRIN